MSRCTLALFILSLVAIALNLAGVWKYAGDFAAVLFALTLVLALLGIINDSDKNLR